MTNVTNVTTLRRSTDIEYKGDDIMFPVLERPLVWVSKTGETYDIDTHKVLLRARGEYVPTQLAIVGSGFKVIHNSDLFPAVEADLYKSVERKYLEGATCTSSTAYDGRDCYREYIFPNMRVELRNTTVSFRIIIGNSYGGAACTLMAGGIDWWCSNGMVVGSAERYARRHTSGASIPQLQAWVAGMVDIFWKRADVWLEWQQKPMTRVTLTQITDKLVKEGKLSERRATWLVDRFITECDERGGASLWEVYSAITNWATHSPMRDTGNDHAATTRLSREREASRIMQDVVRLAA